MTDYTPEQREGKHGEKMIEVKVRFWTDNLASDAGKVIPKHAWTSGVVRIASNKSHGIVPKNPKPFNFTWVSPRLCRGTPRV